MAVGQGWGGAPGGWGVAGQSRVVWGCGLGVVRWSVVSATKLDRQLAPAALLEVRSVTMLSERRSTSSLQKTKKIKLHTRVRGGQNLGCLETARGSAERTQNRREDATRTGGRRGTSVRRNCAATVDLVRAPIDAGNRCGPPRSCIGIEEDRPAGRRCAVRSETERRDPSPRSRPLQDNNPGNSSMTVGDFNAFPVTMAIPTDRHHQRTPTADESYRGRCEVRCSQSGLC